MSSVCERDRERASCGRDARKELVAKVYESAQIIKLIGRESFE